tara:strand:+ start:1640 stop:1894 length:255 start_codon:yes stop_codon:yes gene_type:complete
MTNTQRFGQPQVGDLYVSETQERIHILVAYEFVYKDRIDFYKYYKSTLRRLDDGAITSWTKPQHEFYRKYKPLNAETKEQADRN